MRGKGDPKPEGKEVKMKKPKQVQIAEELGISKSYLSMILSGQRKCPVGLMERLQAIPGVHKVVDNQVWDRLCKQEVRGSNPLSSTTGGGAVAEWPARS